MAKTLGLDLGTNSIGWAVVEKENIFSEKNGEIQRDEKFTLFDKGVHIFQEGIKYEKGNEKSRAAERTKFRSARRLKFRRKLRKYETLKVLIHNKMCPLQLNELENWRMFKNSETGKYESFKNYPKNKEFIGWLRTDEERKYNPYYLRDLASRKIVSKLEMGRAFYHIAQRRGFLSNRLVNTDEGLIEQHEHFIKDIIKDANSKSKLNTDLNEYFKALDIIGKNNKELEPEEQKLKKLYNAFLKIFEVSESTIQKTKDDLIIRLERKENLGVVNKDIFDLSEKIKENGCITLGQYFYKLYESDRNNPNFKIRKHYTARIKHYLHEFDIICRKQKLNGIDLTEKDYGKRYSGVVKELYRAIFFQRPLKSQKGLVGKCSLEKNKTRCPISHPNFEEYRMLCFINNIKIKTPEDKKLSPLTTKEKEKIKPKFYRKSKEYFDFVDLKKTLGISSYFNFKDNTTVSSCPTSAALKNIFGDNWQDKLFNNYSDKVIRYKDKTKTKIIKEEIKSRNDVINDIWHVLFSFDSIEKLKIFALEKLNLDEETAIKFSQIKLKKEYASLSLKAINKIIPYLKQGLIYSHAVFMANIKNVVDENIWAKQENKDFIINGIADLIANHQIENRIYNVVNGLIKKCIDCDYYYSKEAIHLYTKDIEKNVKEIFGKNAWERKENKQKILSDTIRLFEQQFKKNSGKGKFITIKTINEKVNDFILGDNGNGEVFCTDTQRMQKLFHPSDIEIFKRPKRTNQGKLLLGSPAVSSIKNPMAMRTLHQLKKLINTLINNEIIDENTTIRIELARGLNDANRRKAIQRWQEERKEERYKYKIEIVELYKSEYNKKIEPTEDDILRYQLWKEQKHKEIYEATGNNIGICDIVGSDPKYDIEHTIPRSISNDNSQMNKTLCSKIFNRDTKKKNPF